MPTKEEEKKKLEDSRGQQRTVEDAAPALTLDEIVATGADAEGATDAARADDRAAAARAAAKPGRLTESVPVPKTEGKLAGVTLPKQESTETQKDEAVKPATLPERAVKPAESPYDWWFREQDKRYAEDEARYAEQEERLKRRKLFDTLGHGFGAFHEAYARARGETPMVEASKYGGKWQAQWDKLQEDRAKNRAAHMNARVSMLDAQQRSEDRNALRILRENATNERLKKYQSEIDLLLRRGKTEEAKAKKAEADALVAKARADKLNIDNQYLPRLHEATIAEKQSRVAKNTANTAYTAARTAAKQAKDASGDKPSEYTEEKKVKKDPVTGEVTTTIKRVKGRPGASPSTGQAGKPATNGTTNEKKGGRHSNVNALGIGKK